MGGVTDTGAYLSDINNAAIAVFQSGDDVCVVVGNLVETDIAKAASFLRSEAEGYFGAVVESGSAEGSVPGRWDAHVVVRSSHQRVLGFIRERLGGSPNQMVLQ